MKQIWLAALRSTITNPSVACNSTVLATLTSGAVAKLAQFSSPQSHIDSICSARS